MSRRTGHRGSFLYQSKMCEEHDHRVKRSKKVIAKMKPRIENKHERPKWSEQRSSTEETEIRIMDKFHRRNIKHTREIRRMIKHVLDTTDPSRMDYQHIQTLQRRIDDFRRRHQRYVELLVTHQRQELSFLHQVAASKNLKEGIPSPRGTSSKDNGRGASEAASLLPDIAGSSSSSHGEDADEEPVPKKRRKKRAKKKKNRNRLPVLKDSRDASESPLPNKSTFSSVDSSSPQRATGKLIGAVMGENGSVQRFVDW